MPGSGGAGEPATGGKDGKDGKAGAGGKATTPKDAASPTDNGGAGGSDNPGTGGAPAVDASTAVDSAKPDPDPEASDAGATPGPTLGSGNPNSTGLDRHDALYCGEWQLTNPGETIYLVKGGKVVWSHAIGDNDELGDCTIASNGHVFFSRKAYGAQEIEPDLKSGKGGKIVWEYRQDAGTEVHTAQPIGLDKVLVMQNGTPAKLMLINTKASPSCRSGMPCVEKTWNPESKGKTHGMFRHVRMLGNGHLLVPYTSGMQNKVVEYDQDWKVVWEYPNALSPWAAVRLKNGNTLISGNANKYVREVNPQKETVWELTQADLPDIKFLTLQEAMRLSNGNTIINNWCGGGLGKDLWAAQCVQVFEVTPAKKVVWKVQQWKDPNLGPGSSTQLLDEPGIPEKPGDLMR